MNEEKNNFGFVIEKIERKDGDDTDDELFLKCVRVVCWYDRVKVSEKTKKQKGKQEESSSMLHTIERVIRKKTTVGVVIRPINPACTSTK